MSSDLKKIKRKCIEHGKKHKSCQGCDMRLPGCCILGIPANWDLKAIRSWFEKKESINEVSSL